MEKDPLSQQGKQEDMLKRCFASSLVLLFESVLVLDVHLLSVFVIFFVVVAVLFFVVLGSLLLLFLQIVFVYKMFYVAS